MTSPVVGTASVELLVDAKSLAKSVRKEVEAAFKDLNLSSLIQESIGDTKIKVPVVPDFDTDGIGEKVRRTRVPKVPVEVDPLFEAFRAELKRQSAALAKQVNVKVPVEGDTAGLRTELGSQLKAISDRLRVKVPTEPGDRATFQAELQQQLAEVSARLKAHIGVEPDTGKLPEKVRETRIPPVKVQVDPLLAAFQAEVKRQTAALAKTANANVPVRADTTGLRAEIGASLAAVQRQLKAQIPTEPEGKGEYALKLRALVDEATAKVKAHVNVEPDVKGSGSSITRALQGITPNLGGLSSAVQGLVSGFGQLVSSAAPAGSALSSVGAAAGPIGAVAAALVAAGVALGGLAVAATVAGPALLAAAGAAAAIPAALAGLGAVVGTLGLGLKGISEAFKPKAGGGGGGASQVANQARQIAAASRQVEAARRGIAAANRGLENAERSLTQAQDAYTKAVARSKAAEDAVAQARRDAVDDIDDLNRALRGSKLSEQEAAQAVEDALRDLESAKLTGDIPSINRADLAYQRALLTLEDTKDASEDLQKQVDETNKSGVDGTDRVKRALAEQASALDDVKRSQEGVRDAQAGLLSAQDGLKSATDGLKSAQEGLAAAQEKTAAGSAAAAAKMIPLAKNARLFVDAVKALKPAFEELRLDVQNRLFANLDTTVTSMWKAWKDQLHATLGSFADSINGFLRNLGSSVSTPEFIAGISAGAEGARQALTTIGSAITTSLIPALGTLSGAAGPFLATVGGVIADLVTDFGNWIRQANDSGALKDFFARAAAAFKSITTTGKLVVQIIGDLFSILTGADPASGKTALDSFNTGLQKVHDFLSDPANQQQLRDFVADLKDGLIKFGEAAAQVKGFLDRIDADGKSGSVGEDLGRALVAGIAAGIGQEIKDRLKDWTLYLGPTGVLLKIFNELLGINSPSTVMMEVGRQLIAGLVAGIRQSLQTIVAGATTVRTTILNTLSGAGSWLYNTGRTAITGLTNGISGAFGNLRTIAGNARITVQNALINAGSWLYQHGRAVINGLIQGIQSMFNTLGSFLGGVGSFIQAHKGPLDADRKLLVGAGQAIMGGLIAGLGDRKDALAAQLADISSIVAATALPSLGIDTAQVAGSLSVADQRQVLLGWKPTATGDQLLDKLADLIDLRFNGNVQAALSRTTTL